MMLISLFILFLALTTIDAQSECSNKNANCVHILNCPEIVNILRKPSPFLERTLQMFRSLQCGIEGSYPKICCNQIMTETTTSETSEDTPNPPDVTNHPNLRLLDHKACGPIIRPKVFNGNKTAIFEYPWMARVTYQRIGRPNPEFLCSGTVISSRYVLTAAQCVALLPSDTRLIGVRVGDYDASKERDCIMDLNEREVVCAERYQDLGVDNFYAHPEFMKMGQLQNDIALIRLNDTIDFNLRNIKPICLPFGSATNLIHKKAEVTGWGTTEFGLRNSELLSIKLPIVPNKYCGELYSYMEIWYKQLCAGGQISMEHPCNGDVGGPLQAINMYNNCSVRMVQYGVASYGRTPCDIELIPGVFTNVAYYMDWILNTMTD